MQSYQIELKGEILHVGFNRNFPAQGDRIVKDAENTNELLGKAPLLTGSIHRVKRGENLSNRPMVQALAKVLIHLTKC
jgi:hypothetical protein